MKKFVTQGLISVAFFMMTPTYALTVINKTDLSLYAECETRHGKLEKLVCGFPDSPTILPGTQGDFYSAGYEGKSVGLFLNSVDSDAINTGGTLFTSSDCQLTVEKRDGKYYSMASLGCIREQPSFELPMFKHAQ